jgi:SMI1-KNR4 cell-wall
MAFEALEAHLKRLGIVPLGDAFEPIAADVWLPIEAAAEGHFPPVVRWLFERFGGFQFAEGALYDTPTDRGLLFGAFLSGAEVATAFDDTRDSMPDSFVPLIEDGGGNYLSVDLASGAIAFWVHDAPRDRNVEPVAASAEAFFQSLYKGQ